MAVLTMTRLNVRLYAVWLNTMVVPSPAHRATGAANESESFRCTGRGCAAGAPYVPVNAAIMSLDVSPSVSTLS
jgi:hypothetical protein